VGVILSFRCTYELIIQMHVYGYIYKYTYIVHIYSAGIIGRCVIYLLCGIYI